MLLSFSVENFRSFRAEQTFNLLASKRLGVCSSPHCCEVPGTGENVLRVASLYGANGAGKSNLVRALDLVDGLVRCGTPPGKPIAYRPFLLDGETSSKPTSFELQYLADGEVFRYGFCYDRDRIHEEWLDVYEGKKERNLFSRATNEDGGVTVSLGPAAAQGASDSQKVRALAEVGARPNQLFLTEVVNLYDPEAQGPRFQRAVKWFSSTLAVIEADTPFTLLAHTIATDEAFAEFAGRFLQEASTGISGLEVQTKEISKSDASLLPSAVWERLLEDVAEGDVGILARPGDQDIFVNGSRKDVFTLRKIAALHQTAKGQRTRLPLNEESDGSRRLLNLLPALYGLTTQGGVFVIDELERSMHPMLARKFIEFFSRAVRRTKSQLVFTTHETTLLDLHLLRRDGIWFAEKDNEGATHLYSLADFKVRKDLRIEKGYLEGRFGAIPFLGGIDHLIEEQAAAEPTA
jgi:AAA15 family ATPase/GTPase